MEIEKHIKNLEKYCEVDDLFEKDGDFKEFCDGHIADIKAVIQELNNTQSDLYEANNRIADLLLILGDRDRMIDLMLDTLIGLDSDVEIVRKIASINTKEKKEHLLEIYEKRCKDAKE